jgi:hypothetical protein
MARISTYIKDPVVTKDDKVIGSDISGSTRNYSMEDIAGFLNTSSLINVNGQLVYKFQIGSTPQAGSFTVNGGQPINFSNVTSIDFSHINTNGQNIQQYLEYFEGLFIMLTQTDNQNNFGQYAITSVTDSGNDYSTFTLTFREGNGSLVADKYYTMSFSPKGQSDKHHVYDDNGSNKQFLAGQSYTVTHNLNKFPSVTTVDSAGSHLIGNVQHINNNSFNVTFSATFYGKVYSN